MQPQLPLQCDWLFPGDNGKLQWTGNWVTFLDTMLQMVVVGMSGRSLRLPTRIRSVCVDPVAHPGKAYKFTEGKQGMCDQAILIDFFSLFILLFFFQLFFYWHLNLQTFSCLSQYYSNTIGLVTTVYLQDKPFI